MTIALIALILLFLIKQFRLEKIPVIICFVLLPIACCQLSTASLLAATGKLQN
jgi:hypothetical protein